jgi:hypothetical protein
MLVPYSGKMSVILIVATGLRQPYNPEAAHALLDDLLDGSPSRSQSPPAVKFCADPNQRETIWARSLRCLN